MSGVDGFARIISSTRNLFLSLRARSQPRGTWPGRDSVQRLPTGILKASCSRLHCWPLPYRRPSSSSESATAGNMHSCTHLYLAVSNNRKIYGQHIVFLRQRPIGILEIRPVVKQSGLYSGPASAIRFGMRYLVYIRNVDRSSFYGRRLYTHTGINFIIVRDGDFFQKRGSIRYRRLMTLINS
jgi:hypothetical protein